MSRIYLMYTTLKTLNPIMEQISKTVIHRLLSVARFCSTDTKINNLGGQVIMIPSKCYLLARTWWMRLFCICCSTSKALISSLADCSVSYMRFSSVDTLPMATALCAFYSKDSSGICLMMKV